MKRERGLHHENVEAIQLLDNSELLYEGLNEQNTLSWYHEHFTQDIGPCNTTIRPPIVSGTLTRDASAVFFTVNNG
jgi:hypothetical protein